MADPTPDVLAKLADAAQAFAYNSEIYDSPEVSGLQAPCMPRALYKDPNSLKPYRRGTFLFKLTFTAAANPGDPNTLTLAATGAGAGLLLGTAGVNENGAATGWGDFNGGLLTTNQTDFGTQGSLAYAQNYVFMVRALSIYPNRPFVGVGQSPNLVRTYPEWLKPYIDEITEVVHQSVHYSIKSGVGTCEFRVDRSEMNNAMGGLIPSETPSNSQGIARNFMRLQCAVPAGVINDPDKLNLRAEIPMQAVIQDNGDVPFQGDVYVPVSVAFPGRQYCRAQDAGECPAPGIAQLQAAVAELQARLAQR